MSSWIPLQSGDSIYIVAPAAGTLDAWNELAAVCELIRAAGFVPVHDEAIFADHFPLQVACGFANTDEARYQAFVRAVHSDSRVIWSFRGGYGCDRVAERLRRDGVMPQSVTPKLLVGFSDITVLHHYCRRFWHWPALHAPTLQQLALNKINHDHVSQLWQWLKGERVSLSLSLQGMNPQAGVPCALQADIMGGNLTVIQSTMGTPWEMPQDGIVLFEDVNEQPYRIARILQQWLSSHWLKTAKAVIFADFLGDQVSEAGMDAVLLDFAAQFPAPVLRCRDIGHGKNNLPILFGRPATLELGMQPVLSVGL